MQGYNVCMFIEDTAIKITCKHTHMECEQLTYCHIYIDCHKQYIEESGWYTYKLSLIRIALLDFTFLLELQYWINSCFKFLSSYGILFMATCNNFKSQVFLQFLN